MSKKHGTKVIYRDKEIHFKSNISFLKNGDVIDNYTTVFKYMDDIENKEEFIVITKHDKKKRYTLYSFIDKTWVEDYLINRLEKARIIHMFKLQKSGAYEEFTPEVSISGW